MAGRDGRRKLVAVGTSSTSLATLWLGVGVVERIYSTLAGNFRFTLAPSKSARQAAQRGCALSLIVHNIPNIPHEIPGRDMQRSPSSQPTSRGQNENSRLSSGTCAHPASRPAECQLLIIAAVHRLEPFTFLSVFSASSAHPGPSYHASTTPKLHRKHSFAQSFDVTLNVFYCTNPQYSHYTLDQYL